MKRSISGVAILTGFVIQLSAGQNDALCQSVTTSRPNEPHDLVFVAKPTKQVFATGEAIEFIFSIENKGGASAVVASHFSLTQNLSLEIRDSRGTLTKWCGHIASQFDSPDAFRDLPAGESRTSKIVVSCINKNEPGQAWGYLVDKPGKYTVVASYFLPQPSSFFKKLFPRARVDRGPIRADAVEIEVK